MFERQKNILHPGSRFSTDPDELIITLITIPLSDDQPVLVASDQFFKIIEIRDIRGTGRFFPVFFTGSAFVGGPEIHLNLV